MRKFGPLVFQSRPLSLALVGLTLFAAGGVATAAISTFVSQDEVIERSDNIFVAVCESRSSRFRAGNFITTYIFRASEVWKGDLTDIETDGVLEIEQIGGSDPNGVLPIHQYFDGSAFFVPGEEVLLFTRRADASAQSLTGRPAALSLDSPRMTSLTKSRFSIITDPASGERRVVVSNVSDRGNIPSDKSQQSHINNRLRRLGALSASERDLLDDFMRTDRSDHEIREFQTLSSIRDYVALKTAQRPAN